MSKRPRRPSVAAPPERQHAAGDLEAARQRRRVRPREQARKPPQAGEQRPRRRGG